MYRTIFSDRPLDPKAGTAYRDCILRIGNIVTETEMVNRLLGRPYNADAYMHYHGMDLGDEVEVPIPEILSIESRLSSIMECDNKEMLEVEEAERVVVSEDFSEETPAKKKFKSCT